MEYQLIYSERTTLGIQVAPEGNVIIRAPYGYPRRKIKQVLRMKAEWIQRKAEQKKTDAWYINAQPYQEEEKEHHRSLALEIFTEKVEYYAALMGLSYKKIEVMEKRTRWGICTKDGRLLFNWRLILAPEEAQDYVVVSTLAYLKNYPFQTIRLVERFMPEHQIWRQWLKDYRILLWCRE